MYTSNKVLANATLMITGPYYVPNAKIDTKAVCTNNVPNGAFRGFGGPQACFAAEMQMNKLAEALEMGSGGNTLEEYDPGRARAFCGNPASQRDQY